MLAVISQGSEGMLGKYGVEECAENLLPGLGKSITILNASLYTSYMGGHRGLASVAYHSRC